MTVKFKDLCVEDYGVPVHTAAALERYVDQGLYPGSFLESVLTNDLAGAVCRADPFNRERLPEIVLFMIDRMPSPSWGSPEEVARWIQTHFVSEGIQ